MKSVISALCLLAVLGASDALAGKPIKNTQTQTPSLVAVDANGTEIGPVVGVGITAWNKGHYWVLFEADNSFGEPNKLILPVIRNNFATDAEVYFDLSGCVGTPFLNPSLRTAMLDLAESMADVTPAVIVGNSNNYPTLPVLRYLYIAVDIETQFQQYASKRDTNNVCYNTSGSGNLLLAEMVNDLPMVPYYIELR